MTGFDWRIGFLEIMERAKTCDDPLRFTEWILERYGKVTKYGDMPVMGICCLCGNDIRMQEQHNARGGSFLNGKDPDYMWCRECNYKKNTWIQNTREK